jgi:putative transposase
MISDLREDRHEQEQAQRSADYCGLEASRGGTYGGRRSPEVRRVQAAWKVKFGGMEASEAQKLRAPESENGRLKRLVADLSRNREMLKAVIANNGLSS